LGNLKCALVGWEPALKAICKAGGPSSEEHVMDDRDDTGIMIGSQPLQKVSNWVVLKES